MVVSVSSYFRKLFKLKPKSNLPIIDVDKRFEIMGRTGQGSMSKVFRARDRDFGRTVCLKLLDKEKTAKFEARFVGMNRPLEGFISSALRHKNIVQTFEYGMTKKGEQYAETKGLFTNRVADRGCDYFDHRCHRHSQPVKSTYCRQRIVCRSFGAYHRYRGSYLPKRLSRNGLCAFPG
jgi:serine/threonine protein kinase